MRARWPLVLAAALWAAADCWSSLDDALLIEASAPIRALGQNAPVAVVLGADQAQ